MTATWIKLFSSGDTPTARSGHAMAVLDGGTAVVFGGGTGTNTRSYRNDIHQLAVLGTSATWLVLSSSGRHSCWGVWSLHGGT